MTVLPDCVVCRIGERDHPCRRNGVFDPVVLGAAYFANVARASGGEGGGHWSFSCLDDLCRDHPEAAWLTILDLLPRLETVEEASIVAAGPVEDLIARQGDVAIVRIEDLAGRSARFRFVLSGVRPQGNSESDIWNRVLRARGPGPDIDMGDPLPPV